jgi:hypothetical protein
LEPKIRSATSLYNQHLRADAMTFLIRQAWPLALPLAAGILGGNCMRGGNVILVLFMFVPYQLDLFSAPWYPPLYYFIVMGTD